MTDIIDFVSAKKLKDEQVQRRFDELVDMLKAAGFSTVAAQVAAKAPYYELVRK